MTQHLNPAVIAEALAGYDEIHVGDDSALTFDHKGSGEMAVTLWRWDHDKAHDVEVEARTFRIVEVES